MRTKLTILFLLFSCLLFGQGRDSIYMLKQGFLNPSYKFLIGSSDKYIYEKYGCFKMVYSLWESDTLNRIDDSHFKGKKINISIISNIPVYNGWSRHRFTKINFCDSIINERRNENYYYFNFYQNERAVYKRIGTHVKLVDDFDKAFLVKYPFYKICSNNYIIIADSFYKAKETLIDKIYNHKIDILSNVSDSSHMLSDNSIDEYINQSRDDETDRLIFYKLMINHTNQFLFRLDLLKEDSFNGYIYSVIFSPDNIYKEKVKMAFLNSNIGFKYKNRIEYLFKEYWR